MELATDEPRMIGELDDLDKLTIRRQSAQPHAVLSEHVTIGIRDFIPMPMPFAHLGLAVDLRRA